MTTLNSEPTAKREAKQPFFAYIPLNAAHGPHVVPEEYYRQYLGKPGVSEDTAKFFGMIENIDTDFGALLKKLEEWGIADNTLVIYPLACFLIGARANSYFCYGWGYNIADGRLIEYPEYKRKPGPPKGEAVRQPGTWMFRREFEHANVSVDLEKREGGIQWLAD